MTSTVQSQFWTEGDVVPAITARRTIKAEDDVRQESRSLEDRARQEAMTSHPASARPTTTTSRSRPNPVQMQAGSSRVSHDFGAMSTASTNDRPAGFWLRVAAKLVDGVVIQTMQIVVLGGVLIVLRLGLPSLARKNASQGAGVLPGVSMTLLITAFVVLLLALNVASFLYTVLSDGGSCGQSVGRRLLGIRLLSDPIGPPLGFWRAVGRSFVTSFVAIPLGLGLLAVAWDRRKRGWHDHLLGTQVIKSRPLVPTPWGMVLRPVVVSGLVMLCGGAIAAALPLAAVRSSNVVRQVSGDGSLTSDNETSNEATDVPSRGSSRLGISGGVTPAQQGPQSNRAEDPIPNHDQRTISYIDKSAPSEPSDSTDVWQEHVDPPPSQPARWYLSDVQPVESHDLYTDSGPAAIDGQNFEHSVSGYFRTTYEPRDESWDLGRRATRFRTVVGLRDDSQRAGKVRVELLADGLTLWDGELSLGMHVPLDVDISGALRLMLRVTSATTDDADVYVAMGDAQALA